MSVYKDNPLEYKDEIPIFSTPDSYTNNYEIISSDHIKSITGKSSNPWIPNDIWNEMESSTFDLFYKYSESVREKAGIKVLDVGVGLAHLRDRLAHVGEPQPFLHERPKVLDRLLDGAGDALPVLLLVPDDLVDEPIFLFSG